MWLSKFVSLWTNPPWESSGLLKIGLTGWREVAQPPCNWLQLLNQCDLHSLLSSKRFWAWVFISPSFKQFADMVLLKGCLPKETVLTQSTCGSEDRKWSPQTALWLKGSLRLYFQDKPQGTTAMQADGENKWHQSQTPLSVMQSPGKPLQALKVSTEDASFLLSYHSRLKDSCSKTWNHSTTLVKCYLLF